MQICGFNKTTLLDYPKHLAATIFLGGCNFRCPFCQNASLVIAPQSQPFIEEQELFSFLEKRRHILEGVCISGGEPTIQKELPDFIEKIKALGLKVKLDTNGNHPDMIKYLSEHHLIDFIAMDIKNSKENYASSIGISSFDIEPVCESVSYLMSCRTAYEFRTTVVKELHSMEDFIRIGSWIQGAHSYYLQAFQDSGDILCSGYTGCSKSELNEFRKILLPMIPNVSLRGI